VTSSHGTWRHSGVQFLLFGGICFKSFANSGCTKSPVCTTRQDGLLRLIKQIRRRAREFIKHSGWERELPTTLSPPCPFARFADVGLQGLDHDEAWQTEFGLTFRNLLWQVGSASIRGARFAFGLAGICRFYEQSWSTYAAGEAWALRAISCAFNALLVCPVR